MLTRFFLVALLALLCEGGCSLTAIAICSDFGRRAS